MLGGRIDKRLRGSLKNKRGRTPLVWSRARTAALVGGVAAILVIGLLGWYLWPSPEVEPRPREYRDATACLLTDAQGVTGEKAAPVWAGMQAASERTHGQVRYLAVSGDQTVDNAKTFVGTFVLGRCALIVAAPGVADEAVRAAAGTYSQQSFAVVGGPKPLESNVTRVDDADLQGAVSTLVGDRLAASE
ncbi:hypothetical protein [Actinoplanes sp. CA-252034]|uniref:hypothetical protein n=1 Tax=Actinoplanes sp. CA-252034 TaxID=3239906 RepID=UPI003D99F850